MAALIPHEKCLVLIDKNYFGVFKNAAAYQLGPLLPSTADRTALTCLLSIADLYFDLTQSRVNCGGV